MNGKQWTANRRIYLDASGKVCEKGDPAAVTLLVFEGRQIPMKQAEELGLVDSVTVEVSGARVTEATAEVAGKAAAVTVADGSVSKEDHEAAIAEKDAKIDALTTKVGELEASADDALKAEINRLNDLLEKAGKLAAEQFEKIEALTADVAKAKAAAKPQPASKPKPAKPAAKPK